MHRTEVGSAESELNDVARGEAPQPEVSTPTPVPELVTGEVIWFASSKGYGMVRLPDGSTALLRLTSIVRLHCLSVPKGAKVTGYLTQSQREGEYRLKRIRSIDWTDADIPDELEPTTRVTVEPVKATVKFFNIERKFGFLVLDENHEQDIFINSDICMACKLPRDLVENDKVLIEYNRKAGSDKLIAVSIKLLTA